MIISPTRKYIFVHSPKTGGTALSLALEQRAAADDILIGDTPKALKRRGRTKKLGANGRLWKHSSLADIEGMVDRAEFDSYFLVTLVRNPWDRAVSYYHWLQDQTWDHSAVRLAKSVEFSPFLNARETQSALSKPYRDMMRDGAGELRTALYVRLEAIDEDLAPFWDHLGFNLSPVAPVNMSRRDADYRRYYTPEDAALLAKICAQDIAQFEYRFD